MCSPRAETGLVRAAEQERAGRRRAATARLTHLVYLSCKGTIAYNKQASLIYTLIRPEGVKRGGKKGFGIEAVFSLSCLKWINARRSLCFLASFPLGVTCPGELIKLHRRNERWVGEIFAVNSLQFRQKTCHARFVYKATFQLCGEGATFEPDVRGPRACCEIKQKLTTYNKLSLSFYKVC